MLKVKCKKSKKSNFNRKSSHVLHNSCEGDYAILQAAAMKNKFWLENLKAIVGG
jgi:hypothetical protein